MTHNHEDERYEDLNKRITKLEKKLESELAEFRVRFGKKHEEISAMTTHLEKYRDDMIDTVKTLTEVTTILKENNKDIADNRDKIEKFSKEILMLKSEIATLKWVLGLGVPIAVTVISALLIKGFGL